MINTALGNVWLRAHEEGPVPARLTEVPDHDWAGFARALGVDALTVRDPDKIARAIEQAPGSGEAFLIDVKTERTERLGHYLKFESVLPRDIYQFVVLSSARRAGVEFEWVDHIEAARNAGLTEEIISALESGPRSLPAPYATVSHCMEIVTSYRSIPDSLQARIIELHGIRGLLIEIVVLCGFYGLIGMVNTSFDVPMATRPTDR